MADQKIHAGAQPEPVIRDSDFLHINLHFSALEQYKLLRTNLSFTIPDGVSCPVIGITSSVRNEGKSTTSVNLSYVYALAGKRVLLIDGDMRLPTLAKKLDMSPGNTRIGLSTLLLDSSSFDADSLRSGYHENWFILPSGPIPPNPSELLASAKMKALLEKLSAVFDVIIIDLPPVNIVSDALAVAPYLTGMIVVVRQGYSTRREFIQCKRQLKLASVKVLGLCLNHANNGDTYRYRYRKHSYGSSYGYKYGYGKNQGLSLPPEKKKSAPASDANKSK